MAKKNNRYSDKQIQFVIQCHADGDNFKTVAEKFYKKFKIIINESKARKIFRHHEANYEYDMTPAIEKKQQERKEECLNKIIKFLKDHSRMPTKHEAKDKLNIGKSFIDDKFGGIAGLERTLKKDHPEAFHHILDETSFTSKQYKKLKQIAKAGDVFVITSAVTGDEPHIGLQTLRHYCKHRGGQLMIQPCSDPAKSTGDKKWKLHKEFLKDNVVFKELKLNKNVIISDIKMTAKQIDATTGLKRIAQREGTMIIANPSLFLQHMTAGINKNTTKAIMTSACITKPDYQSDTYMSDRTGYIANHDHCIGAIIVEVKDNKVFHFRQVQMADDGVLYDINKKYYPDGRIESNKPKLIRMPDYHVDETDPLAKAVWKELIELCSPEYASVEDFFNGTSINPFERKNIILRAAKYKKGLLNLEDELERCADEMNEILTWEGLNQLVYIYGNHEKFVPRYLSECEYMKDPINYDMGILLAEKMKSGWNPVQWALQKHFGLDKDVIFLKETESFKPSGVIENGFHGHLGLNGARNPTLTGLENIGPCSAMHNHCAGIRRDVFRGGTSTYLRADKIGYIEGASSWTQTCIIEHENGSRQLINAIFGEWTIDPDYYRG